MSLPVLVAAHAEAASLGISVQGNKLIDQNGNVIQLRGVVYGGYDFTAVEGWDPSDPSGGVGQGGQADGPNLPAIKSWGANVLRLPLNEASWLGLTCYEPSSVPGQPKSADPGNNYKTAVENQVQAANAAGLYVILDLHWSAPNWPNNYWGAGTGTPPICPEGQVQMADNDHSIAFWTSIATTFQNNPAVMFELFNEPTMDNLTSGQDPWMTMMQGGSVFTQITTQTEHACTSLGINCPETLTLSENWQGVGYQQMLNAVRATGAKNVVLVGTNVWDTDLSQWLANKPTDSLNQMAATWHPYPPEVKANVISQIVSGGTGYAVGDTITLPGSGSTVYAPAVLTVTSVGSNGQVTNVSINNGSDYLYSAVPANPVGQITSSGRGTGAAFNILWNGINNTWPETLDWPTVQTIAAQVPVVITETGAGTGNIGLTFLQQLLPWADTYGISYLGQIWDIWTGPNVLITDVSGTPTAGYGVYFRDHLLAQATASTSCGAYASGSTYTVQTSQTTGSTAATTAQCAYGGTQATQTTVTQTYLCANGTPTAQGSPLSITTNTGSPVCNAPPKVNGVCGAANGVAVATAPTTGLCSTGAASMVSGNASFTWKCSGSNGGNTARCSAPLVTTIAASGSTVVPLKSYSGVSGMTADNTGLPFDWGYMTVGGHVSYVVNVANAGTYNLTIIASDPTGGQSLTVAVNGGTPTSVTIPDTGSFTIYKNMAPIPLTLPAGAVTLTLTSEGQHFNIRGLSLAPQ